MTPEALLNNWSAAWRALGVAIADEALCIELQNGADAPPTYVAGTRNFYVITRYNWSSYYAMSVLDLGQEVKAAMEQ